MMKIEIDYTYVGFDQFHKPTLLIRDPELLKQITVKDFDSFMDHSPLFSDQSDPLWFRNLIALRGKNWKHMRDILSASFTSSKMKYMFSLILEAVDDFTDYFVGKNKEFIEVELKDVFTRSKTHEMEITSFQFKTRLWRLEQILISYGICVLVVGTKSNFEISLNRMAFTSKMANLDPTQARGPTPKGK
ncbi:cytochrome P450 9e2-like [Cylas formicarius]|uniref:cytochrome P450 9e2-like n=1 Tax=Cylas formicarius TaxID=197179 RepID=UPI0029583AC3|nr:cytochrome P450 9e2-like [Cylas formicarius]XP_060522641.1 cytochrome P450 9e2-like [Cylas formicarius]XP_060522642.1 cytochrome P450 9e2-like [Cylas formicarius]